MWRAHFLNAIKSIVACDDILENIDGRISCATDHGIWHIYIYRPKYEVYVYIYIYAFTYSTQHQPLAGAFTDSQKEWTLQTC